MKIYCRVTSTGLVPLYDSDLEEKKRLKIGTDVMCDIKIPRNYRFLKKFMALVRLTFENLPEHLHEELNVYSVDDMLICLKFELGLFTIIHFGGREFINPGSISFSAMDETEFEAFYHRCIDIILHCYLRGTDREDLLDEIEKFK